jgi:hypothetical protein
MDGEGDICYNGGGVKVVFSLKTCPEPAEGLVPAKAGRRGGKQNFPS